MLGSRWSLGCPGPGLVGLQLPPYGWSQQLVSWEQAASAAHGLSAGLQHCPLARSTAAAAASPFVIGSCTRKKSCQKPSKNSSYCSEQGLLTLLPCCSKAAEFYFTSLLCKPWTGLVLGVLVQVLILKIPWCYLFFAQDSLWVLATEHAVKTLRQRTGTVTVPAPHLSWTVKWKETQTSQLISNKQAVNSFSSD